MPSPSFVKFQRGSAAAYAALQTKEQDALYFIYDKNNPSAGGLLYLGDTLIGGTGVAGSTTLANLTDVDVTSVSDGAILQYNDLTDTWEAVSASSISSTQVKVGTLNTNETVAQAQQRLIPSPKAGDVVIINGEPYIYRSSSPQAWQSLTSRDISTRLSTLETQLGSLEDDMSAMDTRIANAIASANHLTYQVVQSLDDVDDAIDLNPVDIDRTVFLVRNSDNTIGDLYDEYMVVNGAKEKLGAFGANLSNYVTTSTFNSTVSDLEDRFDNYVTNVTFNAEIGSLSDDIAAIQQSITTINERLEWHELDEE